MKNSSLTILLIYINLIFPGCNKQTFDPLDYVNPFICTEGDNGQLYPGASYPFGLVQLSPETEGKSHVGYYYEDEYIEGFSHLRIPGAGSKGKGGGILIKPGTGNFSSNINDFREKYFKESEDASPGYYKIVLNSGVKAELTVSEKAGFHRYTFPAEIKKNKYIVIDLSHSYEKMLDARVKIRNENEISGMIKALNNNTGSYHKMYYAIISDSPFKSYITWKGDSILAGDVLEGNNIGVWLNLPDESKVVQLKVALSPISEEMAMFVAKNELTDLDFDNVREKTASEWKKKLSRVEIKDSSKEFKTLFYTHLYHSYLNPGNATAPEGSYRTIHQPDSLYNTRNIAPDFTYYSTWSLWDDFRKYSLISLLEPQIAKNISRSLIEYYKHRNGGDPKFWPTPSIRMEFTGAVIMDSYNKGLGDFDLRAAYRGMREDYERYSEGNVSRKLEKAYHAYIALKMARIIGESEDTAALNEASQSYRDIWCRDQKDNQGNIRGFFTPNGKTVPEVEEMERYADEGNLWHYRWFVLHDINGLAELAGGKDKLSDDLEYFFENNFYMHLNEPDYHAPFLFNYLGKPHLTQKWARTFTTKKVIQLYHNHGTFEKPVVNRIYRTDHKGYIETMDDDAGAMSSWFVMSTMGLFPYDPVIPVYQIGSPVFRELILHLDNGKDFRILAKNVSEDNFYIKSARLNGKNYNQSWIDYETIVQGGVLEFSMDSQSNEQWGISSFK